MPRRCRKRRYFRQMMPDMPRSTAMSVPLMQETAMQPPNKRQAPGINGKGAELASRAADA